MKRLKIKDAFHSIRNGANIKQDKSSGGIPITRIESISDSEIDLNKLGYAGIVDDSLSDYYLMDGDILMSHINSVSHLGKVAIYENRPETIIHGMNLLCLKANKNILFPRYAFYYFRSPSFINSIKPITKKSVNQASFNISNFEKLHISLPEKLEDQIRIATILSKAEALIKQRKESIDLLDEYLKSTFLEMFGDPMKNEKGWELASLGKYGVFKNGLNYTRSETGTRIKYLGVGDFKNKYKIDDISSLSELELNDMPTDEYLLKDGDIVFVRSNGNKELVGRCLSIHPNKVNVTFSGFCIRYRLTSNNLYSIYLTHLFRIDSFKQSMLKSGKGANIQNINQSILNNLLIPVPSLDLQTQFAQIVEKVEAIKVRYKNSLLELENLYGALSQKAFKGELEVSGLAVFYEEEYSSTDNDRTEPIHFNKPINFDTISVLPSKKEKHSLPKDFNYKEGRRCIKQLSKKNPVGFSFQDFTQELINENIKFTHDEVTDYVLKLLKEKKLTQFYASINWMKGMNEAMNNEKEYIGDEGSIWFLVTDSL